MRQIFEDIYKTNGWQSDESVSGHGSTLDATSCVRRELPKLFKELRVKNVLDIPCGDYNWWKEMDLPDVHYVGGDVVPEIIEANQKFSDEHHSFAVMDITEDLMQGYDLIFVRDLLGHFGEADLQLALACIRMSRPKYLLATTFPNSLNTLAIRTGQWRPLNLAYHCGLLPPIRVISEGNHIFKDKSLGLWKLN